MKRFLIVIVIAGVALAAASAYQYWARPAGGDPAPAFTLSTVDGQPYDSAELAGTPHLIHFWATWCGPCRQELPALDRLARDLAPQGLRVVGIAEDEGAEPVRAFLAAQPMSFPVLLDREGEVADRYMSWGIPETILVDGTGTIVWRGAGAREWDSAEMREWIEEELEKTGT